MSTLSVHVCDGKNYIAVDDLRNLLNNLIPLAYWRNGDAILKTVIDEVDTAKPVPQATVAPELTSVAT